MNEIIINGKAIYLNEFSKDIDLAFHQFYSAYMNNGIYSWNDFEKAINVFYSENNNPGKHGEFFNNFTPLWQSYLLIKDYNNAERLWEKIVDITRNWENNKYYKIHKGTAYYFWGVTALLSGKLEKGYSLVHMALEEDKRESKNDFPDQPALALATLNITNTKQYFYNWVYEKYEYLNTLLKKYRDSYNRQLDYEYFNKIYLQSIPNKDAVFSFSYLIARLCQIKNAPYYVFENSFSAQIFLELIFKMTLIIEYTINQKNDTGSNLEYYYHKMNYLSKKINIRTDYLNDVKKSAKIDFNSTFNKLINKSYLLENKTESTEIENDIALSYICRNYAAHELRPITNIIDSFNSLEQSIFNVYFLSVETLY